MKFYSHKFCSNKNKSGFTLVELLISMTIVGIMAALSISSYPKFSEQISLAQDTYKILSFAREIQTFGVSAMTLPGVKFVYAFEVDRSAGTIKRYKIENPTNTTNSYYQTSLTLDPTGEIITIKANFEISEIAGISSTGTTTLNNMYSFFRRPNPEG